MGNTCATRSKENIYDRFPSDVDTARSDTSDVFDDQLFKQYMEGKQDFVEDMVKRGSSFRRKSENRDEEKKFQNYEDQFEADFGFRVNNERGLPNCFRGTRPLPKDNSVDSDSQSRFSDGSGTNFGFRIETYPPVPLCFRGPRTPRGDAACFDSDSKSVSGEDQGDVEEEKEDLYFESPPSSTDLGTNPNSSWIWTGPSRVPPPLLMTPNNSNLWDHDSPAELPRLVRRFSFDLS